VRQSLLRRIMTMTAVLLLALVAAGCDRFSGEGSLRSANPTSNQKATFFITGRCEVDRVAGFGRVPMLHEGVFRYRDPGAGVSIRGGDIEPTIYFTTFDTCRQVEQFFHNPDSISGAALFRGTYRPANGGRRGEFEGSLSDGGEPGFLRDTFSITVISGKYSGYTNTGPIESGNIQVN
jgi:hypothetical protein